VSAHLPTADIFLVDPLGIASVVAISALDRVGRFETAWTVPAGVGTGTFKFVARAVDPAGQQVATLPLELQFQ